MQGEMHGGWLAAAWLASGGSSSVTGSARLHLAAVAHDHLEVLLVSIRCSHSLIQYCL